MKEGKATAQKRLVRNPKTRQWEYKAVRLKGSFGETNYYDKTIKVNKGMSKKAAKVKKGHWKKFGMSKKDTSVINTIVHERGHALHPKMLEKNIRKMAHKQVARMSRKQKSRLYAKVA